MERPSTPDGSADESRTAALDERPTPRRNRRSRFRRGEGPIPEYELPRWRKTPDARDAEPEDDPTAALPRNAAQRDHETDALPRRGWEEDAGRRDRDDATAALPSDGHW